jgi:hypothetical protein
VSDERGWKDATGYGRDDRERTPRTWELAVGRSRLVVTRHRDYGPDVWLMRCDGGLFIGCRELKAKDVADAKVEALAFARSYAESIAAAFGAR